MADCRASGGRRSALLPDEEVVLGAVERIELVAASAEILDGEAGFDAFAEIDPDRTVAALGKAIGARVAAAVASLYGSGQVGIERDHTRVAGLPRKGEGVAVEGSLDVCLRHQCLRGSGEDEE